MLRMLTFKRIYKKKNKKEGGIYIVVEKRREKSTFLTWLIFF